MVACLYPPIEPFAQYRLNVGDGHTLYFEQCGHPNGMPILFLHGGPGSGSRVWHRQLFDPGRWRAILFDQRGAGRSQPAGWTKENTTQNLVADIERVRNHLGIEHWRVFGGSWGAALGLLYAQCYPHRVTQLILRGAFLARRVDLDWFVQPDGAAQRFPDAYRRFVNGFTKDERNDPILAYTRRLTAEDAETRLATARQWAAWEELLAAYPAVSETDPGDSPAEPSTERLTIALHYARNRYFLGPGGVMEGMAHMSEVPGVILHGAEDALCRMLGAVELHRVWPGSRLMVVEKAGHALGSPAMLERLQGLLAEAVY